MGNLWFFDDGAALLGATSPVLAALRAGGLGTLGAPRHKKSRTAVQFKGDPGRIPVAVKLA